MIVGRATPQEVLQVWANVKPLLEKSFQFETHTYGVDDILEALVAQEAQLWLAIEGEIKAALVTAVESGPKGRVLSIQHLAGDDMEKWLPEMDKVLTAFCKETGCQSYEAITDRRGFSQLVPGFEVKGYLLVKRIE